MDIINAWAPYATFGLIIGIVGVLGFYLWKGKERTRLIGGLLSGIVLLMSLYVVIAPSGGGGGVEVCPTGQSWNPSSQKCEIIVTAPWTWVKPTLTQGGGRDAATEIYNDAGTEFTGDCTADTGGGTETLDADGTNLFYNVNTKTFTMQITVDDDASTGVAAFSGPDCHSNDYLGKPNYPIDVNNDGTADNQLAWARLQSVSRWTLVDNSTSQIPVQSFYYSLTEGFQIAFMQEDADQTGAGLWVSACRDSIGKTEFSISDCKPVFIGDTTQAAIYSAFAFSFDSSTPLWGYQNGQIFDYETITIQYGHGAMTGIQWDVTFTYTIQLVART